MARSVRSCPPSKVAPCLELNLGTKVAWVGCSVSASHSCFPLGRFRIFLGGKEGLERGKRKGDFFFAFVFHLSRGEKRFRIFPRGKATFIGDIGVQLRFSSRVVPLPIMSSRCNTRTGKKSTAGASAGAGAAGSVAGRVRCLGSVRKGVGVERALASHWQVDAACNHPATPLPCLPP